MRRAANTKFPITRSTRAPARRRNLQQGRVLLAGDCAHVNNPIGGMGMNGGIHDAINLAEKLSDVWFGRAEEKVLDRYTRQRRKAQVDYVQAQTIQTKRRWRRRTRRYAGSTWTSCAARRKTSRCTRSFCIARR